MQQGWRREVPAIRAQNKLQILERSSLLFSDTDQTFSMGAALVALCVGKVSTKRLFGLRLFAKSQRRRYGAVDEARICNLEREGVQGYRTGDPMLATATADRWGQSICSLRGGGFLFSFAASLMDLRRGRAVWSMDRRQLFAQNIHIEGSLDLEMKCSTIYPLRRFHVTDTANPIAHLFNLLGIYYT